MNLVTSFDARLLIAMVTGSKEAAFGWEGLCPLAISALTVFRSGLLFQKSALIRGLGCWACPVSAVRASRSVSIFFIINQVICWLILFKIILNTCKYITKPDKYYALTWPKKSF